MKLSGLLWLFRFVPQREMNEPLEPPLPVRRSPGPGLTLRMLTKSCGNGPSGSTQSGAENVVTVSAFACGAGWSAGTGPCSAGCAPAAGGGAGAVVSDGCTGVVGGGAVG